MTAAPEVTIEGSGARPSSPMRIGAGPAWLVFAVVLYAATVAVFMTYDLQGALSFALELRGKKVLSMTLVGTSLSTSAVLFHTISANRILTPSLIGLDALYILIQSSAAAAFGILAFLQIDPRLRFTFAVGVMMIFAVVLNQLFIRRAADDLPLLILGGIVLGGMFSSMSVLVARLLDPNEFTILQDLLFANFTTVDEQLLGFSILVVAAAMIVVTRAHHELDVVALGRPVAISLGADYDRLNRVVMMIIALLVSVPTALVGPVTFLGLLAANAAYEATGSFRHRITIPVGALFASTLLIGAQFVLEEVFAFETRVSIIVGFVGGIAFIFLLLREVRR